jgi:hypothetical protein
MTITALPPAAATLVLSDDIASQIIRLEYAVALLEAGFAANAVGAAAGKTYVGFASTVTFVKHRSLSASFLHGLDVTSVRMSPFSVTGEQYEQQKQL